MNSSVSTIYPAASVFAEKKAVPAAAAAEEQQQSRRRRPALARENDYENNPTYVMNFARSVNSLGDCMERVCPPLCVLYENA
jgi:hypothetical protein